MLANVECIKALLLTSRDRLNSTNYMGLGLETFLAPRGLHAPMEIFLFDGDGYTSMSLHCQILEVT